VNWHCSSSSYRRRRSHMFFIGIQCIICAYLIFYLVLFRTKMLPLVLICVVRATLLEIYHDILSEKNYNGWLQCGKIVWCHVLPFRHNSSIRVWRTDGRTELPWRTPRFTIASRGNSEACDWCKGLPRQHRTPVRLPSVRAGGRQHLMDNSDHHLSGFLDLRSYHRCHTQVHAAL